MIVLLAAACGDDSSKPAGTAPPAKAPAAEEPVTSLPTNALAPKKALSPKKGPKAAPPAAEGSIEGFSARMRDLLRICATGTDVEAQANVKDLMMRDARAWFSTTFGEDKADALLKEYAIWPLRIPQLPAEVRKNQAAGKTTVLAERFATPGDEMSTAYQSIALGKMQAPTPLYSLRLVKPGEKEGWHLWSFAWVGGKYRFVGRLMGLSPESAVRELAMLGSLRIKAAREIEAKKRGGK